MRTLANISPPYAELHEGPVHPKQSEEKDIQDQCHARQQSAKELAT